VNGVLGWRSWAPGVPLAELRHWWGIGECIVVFMPEDPHVGADFHVCAQFSLDQVQLGDACSVGAQLWLGATGSSNDVHFGMFSEVRYYTCGTISGHSFCMVHLDLLSLTLSNTTFWIHSKSRSLGGLDWNILGTCDGSTFVLLML
jgi:hypothetical protein